MNPATAAPCRRPGLSRLLALILGLVLASIPLAAPHPAQAATPGRMIVIGGWPVGSFVTSTGAYAYCIEPGAVLPAGAQKQRKTVGSLPGYSAYTFDQSGWKGTVTSGPLSGKRLRQINYVLWKHGRTKSTATAVAVQLAVWILRGDPGAEAWLEHHLDWVREHGGQSRIDRAQEMVAEAKAKAVVATAPKPGALKIAQGDDPGTGTVAYPAGTTQLQIDGGEFAGGAQKVQLNGGKAGSLAWRSIAKGDEWQGEHTVEITGKWSLKASGWPARVTVHPPVVAKQQRLAAGVGPVTSTFSGRLSASETVELRFQPVLSTRVPQRLLSAGKDRFSDTVEFDIAEGSEPWPSRDAGEGAEGEGADDSSAAEFVPIVAEGVVYGPFDTPQRVSGEPPAGAPVAGHARLLADRGPGEYRVESDDRPRGSGYYYWVWSIREEAQTPEVRSGGLLPSGYRFADDFGLVEEGQVVPTALRWSTRLVQRRLVDDGARLLELRDTITVRPRSGWLRDAEGAVIPVRIRLTVYRSDARPERAAHAPRTAERVAHSLVEVNERALRGVRSDVIPLPAGTRGWVTVQACLRHEDQPRKWQGYTEEWCDDYGVPAETARIVSGSAAPPDALRLAETGSDAASRDDGSGPLLGVGLLYSGVSSLLIGGLVRQIRARRRRDSSAFAGTVQHPYT